MTERAHELFPGIVIINSNGLKRQNGSTRGGTGFKMRPGAVRTNGGVGSPAYIIGLAVLVLVPLQLGIGFFLHDINRLILGRLLIFALSGFIPALLTRRYSTALYASLPACLLPLLFQFIWSYSHPGYGGAAGLVYGMFMLYALAASLAAFLGATLAFGALKCWQAITTARYSKR